MKITSAILCSKTKEFDRTKTMSSYACTDCGNKTVVQSTLKDPFCASCGADHLRPLATASKAGRQLMSSTEETLGCVQCPDCKSYLMMNNQTIASHSIGETGHLHCPVCANSITFASAECNENSNQTEKLVEDDTETETTDTVAKTNHTFVLANLVVGKPKFIAARNNVFCSVNNIIIATAELDSEEQAEDLEKALEATKESDNFDLEEALASNKFILASVDVAVDKQLEEDVNEKAEKALEEAKASLLNSTKEAMGLALAGCNRGFFESTDFLRIGLERALVAGGYSAEDATAIADDILLDVADDFVEEIQRITFELLAKPEEVRNELASTVASVKPAKKVTASNSVKLPSPLKPATTTVANKQAKAATTVASVLGTRKLF